jgi:hypothetical protein
LKLAPVAALGITFILFPHYVASAIAQGALLSSAGCINTNWRPLFGPNINIGPLNASFAIEI